jgi:hypothetical protein
LKNLRYKAIKSLSQTEGIHGLKEIFGIIAISALTKDMETNYNTFRRKIADGRFFTINDILRMAELFEIEPIELFRLALFDIKAMKKPGKKGNRK